MRIPYNISQMSTRALMDRLNDLYDMMSSQDYIIYGGDWIREDIWDIEQELKRRNVVSQGANAKRGVTITV